jgi:beta-lactamase regulating signal transducer with metallopeptidase domain
VNGAVVANELVALADWAAVGGLAMLAAWFATRFVRRNAALRHLIWLVAFAAVLAAPLLMAFLPAGFVIHVRPGLSATGASIAAVESISRKEMHPPATSGPGLVGVVGRGGIEALESLSRREGHPSASSGQATPATSGTGLSEGVGYAGASAVDTLSRREVHPLASSGQATPVTSGIAAVGWLLVVWVVGVLLIASQWLVAAIGLRGMWRRSLASGRETPNLVELAARIGVRRAWQLRVSTASKPPAAMTWGVIRPIVMLPQNESEWGRERREAVLLHELAHIRRGDSLNQGLADVVCTLLWFNPAVWLAARALRADAEAAADDAVLRSGVRPTDYASELILLAAELGRRRRPFLKLSVSDLGVSIMKQSSIEQRVRAIVARDHSRRGVTSIEAMGAVFVGLGLTVALALARPGIATNVSPQGAQTKPPVSAPAKPKVVAAQAAKKTKKVRRVRRRTHHVAMARRSRELEAMIRKQAALANTQALLAESRAMLAERAAVDAGMREKQEVTKENSRALAELEAASKEMLAERSKAIADAKGASSEALAEKLKAFGEADQAHRERLVDKLAEMKSQEAAAKDVQRSVRELIDAKSAGDVAAMRELARAHEMLAKSQSDEAALREKSVRALIDSKTGQKMAALAQEKAALDQVRKSVELAQLMKQESGQHRIDAMLRLQSADKLAHDAQAKLQAQQKEQLEAMRVKLQKMEAELRIREAEIRMLREKEAAAKKHAGNR